MPKIIRIIVKGFIFLNYCDLYPVKFRQADYLIGFSKLYLVFKNKKALAKTRASTSAKNTAFTEI
ncbi:hypothetical protein COY65_02935 [Candidatus Jorgensenbacteria bacterium CG_4_10_14_0_8_um_filter_39_13]|uniref:Uncharacterized protein n=2 Tax=Candidatus Joergenseniibacteriota TaxID=1752739 RepID=A0A2M7RGD5_9BACT|nr:MAG: hypothetical protein COV54_02040 [Candidatus Jorgensenbacteria bacterium CG11_big_fil_rev_8_21_14_0_20_38_23]PIV13261.1 MAG: hypothetical protein COS46_01210 [Candidatus Jorgensenbacteria bacterium CG03_land_8_20_14_0_80_38_39]PIW97753.1 MAG: hypothetical protein COZ81_00920 [Candidatus Jorgensenbacteria bacterium CG_4_8_14_3_um_filter_38_10]PIY95591.1 MAG: hypothetical protein COY65_02935 [Candidatus Jorgensenbacteria bacterium CG_4_10_14_0_8_um_filter_39_13]PJA94986.1 MAG: hypothetica